ncbi:MAG: ABC transporter permease [Pirellulales bacterium]
MSFWKIAWRNMQHRALASTLTGLSMALGVAAVICVIVVHSIVDRQFSQFAQGYHLIVGGKGGAMQMVLSTVYHLDKALYPIPWSYYEQFTEGEYASLTDVAVPYCLGDSFSADDQTFRVVATTPDLFDKIQYTTQADGTPIGYTFRDGRNFKSDQFFEAVIGSVVATHTGLKVGDIFNPTHGIGADGDKHEEFKIVGVLEPTGTANDRALFANMEGFYLLEGHALAPEDKKKQELPDEADYVADLFGWRVALFDGIESSIETDDEAPRYGYNIMGERVAALPESQREVTSILVLCKSDMHAGTLELLINKNPDSVAQAVSPLSQVTKLLGTFVSPIQLVLLVLTILIVLVAAIGIFVSIYNSMNERSRDIAVMRALGASRLAVMLITLFESILLSVCGGLVGIAMGHALIGLASPFVEARTGVALDMFQFDVQELILIPALVVLAALVGFLPALSAYRTDVAKSLN